MLSISLYFLLLVTFDRPRFLPHGIPVAAPTCGRWVRGGEPNERVKDVAKTRMKNSTPEGQGCLDAAAGSAMLSVP